MQHRRLRPPRQHVVALEAAAQGVGAVADQDPVQPGRQRAVHGQVGQVNLIGQRRGGAGVQIECAHACVLGCDHSQDAFFLFGAGFIAMEVYEFHHLITEGAGPGRSAYLSAFFTLIGTHGLHVTFGLIWIVVMIDMIRRHGLDSINKRRLACLSLFWHIEAFKKVLASR
ncbi:hypothetical protein [Lactiplantibacillus plantarum]|uniref:hypothetical protein n=1 Tax=Lactiplantibacillus plantarum TaxID=1590 RepID=UPI0040458354